MIVATPHVRALELAPLDFGQVKAPYYGHVCISRDGACKKMKVGEEGRQSPKGFVSMESTLRIAFTVDIVPRR